MAMLSSGLIISSLAEKMIKDTIWNQYKDKIIIGKGTYGLVYKAFDLNSKNYVAIKEIDKKIYHKINNNNFKENMKKIN